MQGNRLENPRVSIVIPVYNGSNYLRMAIDSALAQTYTNIEVIVVNDGSTDSGATELICQSYGTGIKYLVKENGGVSSALNYGIEQMCGEYFSWLSHDDLYLPEKIQRQVEYLRHHKDACIVGSGLEIIDAQNRVIKRYIPPRDAVVENGRDVMEIWIHGCSLLIERNVFEQAGVFNCANKTVQDLEMWLEIVRKGIRFYFLPDILCQWRMHDESDSFAGRQKHFGEVDQLFRKLPQRYSLAFFCDNGMPMTRGVKAEVYEWLGEQGRHRGAVNSVRKFFLLSWLHNLNILGSESRRRLKKLLSTFVHKNTVFVK